MPSSLGWSKHASPPDSYPPHSAHESVKDPLLPPRRPSGAHSGECPDTSDGNPARDGNGYGEPELPRDANDGRADGQRVEVFDGARVLGCKGERLHLVSP